MTLELRIDAGLFAQGRRELGMERQAPASEREQGPRPAGLAEGQQHAGRGAGRVLADVIALEHRHGPPLAGELPRDGDPVE